MRIETEYESKYINVYDIQYEEGRHYYNASRRSKEELIAIKSEEDYYQVIPDGVNCLVIIDNDGEEPRMLLNMERRYCVGRDILNVPAGLIDKEDKGYSRDEAILRTAKRELEEETGLVFDEKDKAEIINACLFSSPGMTDEANAIVKIILNNKDLSKLNHNGACGHESFSDFVVLTKDEAKVFMKKSNLSIYTFLCMNIFVNC